MDENTQVVQETPRVGKTMFVLGAVAVLILFIGLLFWRGKGLTTEQLSTQTALPSPTPQILTLVLNELAESGESGTATIKEVDGKVIVSVELTGQPQDTIQPMHIHGGSCPGVGNVIYPLTNAVMGKSETILEVTLSELLAKRPIALNVHKSTSQPQVYFSCGDIN